MTKSGRERKELGQQLALSVDVAWKDQALHQLKIFCAERKAAGDHEFSVEEFKAWLQEKEFAPPHSHNSWGALTTAARRAGLIAVTGKCTLARAPSAHARLIGIWRAA